MGWGGSASIPTALSPALSGCDRYPSLACEILTSDVPQINDALGADESLLHRLYGFLQSSGSLNPLLASFFSKVMGVLINRKTDQVPGAPRRVFSRAQARGPVLTWGSLCLQLVSFLRKKDDFVDLLLQHIGTSAIMDLLLRLLTCVERPQLRQDVVNVSGMGRDSGAVAAESRSVSGAPPSRPQWLNEEKIVQRLIEQIHPSKDDSVSVTPPPPHSS